MLGPESWSGPIGKIIVTNVWEMPLIVFESFPNPELLQAIEAMPREVLATLKHDYIYLIEIGRGLITGKLEARWADMQAGACSNVCWTNPQSRAGRMWMSTPNPTSEHRRLMNHLVYVYIPTLIEIKMKNILPEGPKHFLALVIRVEKYSTEEEKEHLRPILQFNGYQAHPECVLVAMVASGDREEREKGVEQILRMRKLKKQKPRGRKKIRKFKVPQLNFEATKLEYLTPLADNKLEPPLTMGLSDAEIEILKDTPFISSLPCSTTEVERAVQTMTNSAQKSSDTVQRDGYSFSLIAARKRNKVTNKKVWNLT